MGHYPTSLKNMELTMVFLFPRGDTTLKTLEGERNVKKVIWFD
jgi:hypothetical protein